MEGSKSSAAAFLSPSDVVTAVESSVVVASFVSLLQEKRNAVIVTAKRNFFITGCFEVKNVIGSFL